MDAIEKLVIGFFENLKCDVSSDGGVYQIKEVPKSFEDFYGKRAPYMICFDKEISGAELIDKSSLLVSVIGSYLENSGKLSLLKIDFDVNPFSEIEKAISLKNCEISNIVKRHRNNYFSRFSFITTFRYMNEQEQVINEVYVHEGKIIEGDLTGYSVLEGNSNEASTSHLEKDYSSARKRVRELLQEKTDEVSEIVSEKLEKEIKRIKGHYQNILSELGGDLNGQLERIREMNLQLRVTEGEEANVLRARLNKLKSSLVKIGNDDARERVLKEQEFTIRDAMNKYSLNVDNKLINTTIIYYPIFSFSLFLKNDSLGREIKMDYNPLTKELESIGCDSCGEKISRLNLCSSGHNV